MINFDFKNYHENFVNLISHKKKHETKADNKNILFLIHPFYRQIENGCLENKDFKKYFENLEILEKNRRDLSIILYESPPHYTKSTYLLAEEGFFDKIIFTKLDSGDPHSVWDLNCLNGKNIYLGGMYNGLCVSGALTNILNYSKPSKIIPLKELVLNSTQISKTRCKNSFFPEYVYYRDSKLPVSRQIKTSSFEEFKETFFK